MIVTTAILGAALLLSGDVRLPVPRPSSILRAVKDRSIPPAFVRPDSDAPSGRLRGDMLEEDDDDSDDKVEAQLASSITPFGVGVHQALPSWLPRHGVFRASGRSLVLRC